MIKAFSMAVRVTLTSLCVPEDDNGIVTRYKINCSQWQWTLKKTKTHRKPLLHQYSKFLILSSWKIHGVRYHYYYRRHLRIIHKPQAITNVIWVSELAGKLSAVLHLHLSYTPWLRKGKPHILSTVGFITEAFVTSIRQDSSLFSRKNRLAWHLRKHITPGIKLQAFMNLISSYLPTYDVSNSFHFSET